MQSQYLAQEIERSVQKQWHEQRAFEVKIDRNKEKYYCLSMFPYPSGKLHMGHVRNYTISDVIARFQRMEGKNVLQPMGWDAFGMPAENAAIDHQVAPAAWTYENINYMRNQLKSLGFSIDWSRELATCKPDYFRWEQWLFTRLYEKGLIYKKLGTVNWDPIDQTVLANEQVIEGRGWRSGALVEKREIPMYYFKITDYADELLSSLDTLDGWAERVKTMQRNWIGKSEGCSIRFKVKERADQLQIYTTRPDTLMGATLMAISADHPLATEAGQKDPTLQAFINECKNGSVAEADIAKAPKLGMDTGFKAIHPISGKEIPIWVANYVLSGYGDGALMVVPAHDERDWEFAKKYQLEIIQVVNNGAMDFDLREWKDSYSSKENLTLVNSGEFNGLNFADAVTAIVNKLGDAGERTIQFRLRDWGISRQRYWGCPIPIIKQDDKEFTVPDAALPVVLPEDLIPEIGSPLKKCNAFLETELNGKPAIRESDTMDTFVESSWYFFRYMSPDYAHGMVDPEAAAYWGQVDQYIGGIEHAILHLLYARFFTKLMRDEGIVKIDEPFKNLLTQGMVLAGVWYRIDENGKKKYFNPKDIEPHMDAKGRIVSGTLNSDGKEVIYGGMEKMSKSKNNGVDPQELLDRYGADTARLYTIFTAPPESTLEWSDSAVEGAYKFLKRVWTYAYDFRNALSSDAVRELDEKHKKIRFIVHEQLRSARFDYSRHQFNTVVSSAMKIFNALTAIEMEQKALRYEVLRILLLVLAPIVPHITSAIWEALHFEGDILFTAIPEPTAEALIQDNLIYVVQVNGKKRGEVTVSADATNEEIIAAATALLDVQIVKKAIVVPKKLVNLVV